MKMIDDMYIDVIAQEFWDNLKMGPDLPEAEFRVGERLYKYTDYTYLHPYAQAVLNIIVNQCALTPNLCKAYAYFPVEVSQKDIDIASEIVMHTHYSLEIDDEDSEECGSCCGGALLVMGVIKSKNEKDKNKITYELNSENANIVYDFIQKNPKHTNINIRELVILIADYNFNKFKGELI